MSRLMVMTLLLLLPAFPASGKVRNDAYPISCSQLWNAVKMTLGNPEDYNVVASDDSEMTASYTVVGAQRVRVNSVALNPQGTGCQMKVQSPDAGYMVDDEGLFRKRVAHSLAKLQVAKPAQPTQSEH